MTSAEAIYLAEHLGIDLSQDPLSISLVPTASSIPISDGTSEYLWHFSVYDPVRPLIEVGLHSLSQLEGHPEDAKAQKTKLEAAERSASALDILQDVLGDEKAEFVCTAKDRDNISFLIPEHAAKKLAAKLKANNITFISENPRYAIEEVGGHQGPIRSPDDLSP